MATLSSVLTWRAPRAEEPGGLLPMGSHGAGHEGATNTSAAFQEEKCSLSSTPPPECSLASELSMFSDKCYITHDSFCMCAHIHEALPMYL